MKLSILFDKVPKHSDVLSGAVWTFNEELLTAGDDHKILRWNVAKNESSVYIELPSDLYPLSLSIFPQNAVVGGRKGVENLLLSASDGCLYFFSKNSRADKVIQAHQGAAINGKWSPDGSEILSSGEDGFIRIWSRAGLLRTILAQSPVGVYASCWGPEGRSVIYAEGGKIIIRPTGSGASKGVEWKGHDGIILALSWSFPSNLIVSTAEDCRYKVWDPEGYCIYKSPVSTHPFSSISWSPSGELFAIGGTNIIRLCDRFGWTHAVENPKFGTVYALDWTSDGTQFGGATSEGHVFACNIIFKSCLWNNVEAVLTSRNTVTITDSKGKTNDLLEFKERVIHISMSYGKLIIVVPSQVFIYDVSSVPIPSQVVCDLKEMSLIYLVLQSKKNFILCGTGGISSRTYDGRQLAQIKWPGMSSELLNSRNTSLAEDMLATIDQVDKKIIRVFDIVTGKPLFEQSGKFEFLQVALAQNEIDGSERLLAYIDKNYNLYLSVTRRGKGQEISKRVLSGVFAIIWHLEAPILVSALSGKVKIFYVPQLLFTDPQLFQTTVEEKEVGNTGYCPQFISFIDSHTRIRLADGNLICVSINYFVPQIYNFVDSGSFSKARRICRSVDEKLLWSVLAALSRSKGELGIAEIAFSEIGHYDKVFFLKNISKMPEGVEKNAEKQLFISGLSKAEAVFLQAGKISEAIDLNIRFANWTRAHELTVKSDGDIEKLLIKRQAYLEKMKTDEFLPPLVELAKKYNFERTIAPELSIFDIIAKGKKEIANGKTDPEEPGANESF